MSSSKGSKYRQTGFAKESPYDKANLFEKYWLWFMIPLLRKGHSQDLTLEDIGAPPRVDLSRTLGIRLENHYNQELLNKKKPNFGRAVLKTFGPQLLIFSILDFISKCIALPMQTIALGWLIRDSSIYLTLINPPPTLQANGTSTTNNLTTLNTDSPVTIAVLVDNVTVDEAFWKIVYDAIIIIIFTWISIAVASPFFFQTYHIGMKCRVAACYMIYKKSLRLSQSALSETTVGQMVNLLSNDVNRFDSVAQMITYLFMAPLQSIIVLTILSIFYIGLYPTLATLATVLVYVTIQTSMGRGFSKFRATTAKRTDERIRLMNEIILAMRIIKMYAWEQPFKQLVYFARKREITTIGISSLLKAINQTLFFVSSKIIVFIALMTYVSLNYSFNPQVVFVSIGLANIVRLSLTLFFPNAIAYTAESLISCRRINTFLMLPEIEVSPTNYKASSDGFGCKYVVVMKKVFASWAALNQDMVTSTDARFAIIRDLTISIKPRDFVMVVGRVGSGKTSVLMSMLGELPIYRGRLEINGRISYASQEAWIFSGTVRENILFGRKYEADRYNLVLQVCSLVRDIEILIDSDATIVGERGVSLSGGQKARVNLARALYSRADIYILDDPLSAVDAPVAKYIFTSMKTFLRQKTVVLATHQLQFLRHATKILVVDRDLTGAYGTLQEVMESAAFGLVNYSKEAFEDATTTEAGTDVENLSSKKKRTTKRTTSDSATANVADTSASPSTSATGSGSRRTSGSGSQSPPERQPPPLSKSTSRGIEGEKEDRLIRTSSQASSNLADSVKLISTFDEKQQAKSKTPYSDDAPAEQKALLKMKTNYTGSDLRKGTEVLSAISANFSTYFYYLSNASGIIMFLWFIIINIVAQGFYQYTDFFLSFWTDSVQRKEIQGANFMPQTYVDNLTTGEISGIYAILVALCFFSTFFRTATFFIGTLRASINMHDKLFKSIVHAPMTFFDFSPIGILLNRLTRDIGFVDETLTATAIEIVTIFVNILGVLILTTIIDYKNGIPSISLIIIAFLVAKFCNRTIIRLKQIEGLTRSPIFSHISTTLSGLSTVRAFKVQDNFMRLFDKHQDRHSSSWFNYICSSRWLAMTMDFLCLIFVTAVITILLTLSLNSNNASSIGLLISQAVVITGPFQWGVRQMIEVGSQMTSVQRIKEFSELKPEEQELTKEDLTNQSSYQQRDEIFRPKLGEVKFINLTLSYFVDEPPVLKGLSFTIKPMEKVGVIGRTGAGKSSIVSVLFRLYNFEGFIEIDGVDTKSIPLAKLRSSMSIIPQDPILFGGTLRKNLDPFNDYTDLELWDALDAVQLKRLFAGYTQGLGFIINEGGANFSVGQRQLICLARAIVRKNKILVLDEATANVDPETDIFIQRTIASQFKHCTVITIAHQLVTIVDSDRVLVLDTGEVREFAEPYELLQNESSLFAQMVNSSVEQAPRLRKVIEEEHRKRVAESQTKI